ncbi:MAG TPA: hypothetical protein VNS22_04465 [Geminicoccus sp.]|uniref:hypothetical protein n=1 Tax=Geminicoccus sp. TaxID=2024832 RepID=UPI002D09E3FF|nr:hypothetical protein [Geminicoccus sp.]HWL67620.1 hypothetical protein [Geminicoccus sp.]
MQRAYSVTQIQFDCLSYIKEFGGKPSEWTVATCVEPEPFLRDRFGADRDHGIWLTKPALTPKAAQAVAAHLHSRYRVQLDPPAPKDGHGRHVVLVRRVPG